MKIVFCTSLSNSSRVTNAHHDDGDDDNHVMFRFRIMPTLWWWGAVVALMVSLPLSNADEHIEVETDHISRGCFSVYELQCIVYN